MATNAGYSDEVRSKIKEAIESSVSSYFAGTLGQVQDIVKIVASQIYTESRFNTNALGPQVSYNNGTGGYDYLKSAAVAEIMNNGTPEQKANAMVGLRGLGLSQVMGWNFVKGGSRTGKCEIERVRPDLAGMLCIAPGADLKAHILGDDNIPKAVTSGLVLLESKYKVVQYSPSGYFISSDRYGRKFSSRIETAIAAYLGLGISDVKGTTPQGYAASIVGGSAYKIANGTSVAVKNRSQQVAGSGPSTNGSGRDPIIPAGC